MIFSNEDIEELKSEIQKRLSEKRFLHTLGVMRAAVKLSQLCLPDSASEAAVAALLHDVTKEYSHAEQMKIIADAKISVDDEDKDTPAVLHSFTAPAVIIREFPKYATKNVISAVFSHTIGSQSMSVFDEIIFLADFIEDTRVYDSSIKLRKQVLGSMKENSIEENVKILHKACITVIDYTVEHLALNKKRINSKNILTRNALLSKI